MWRKIIGQPLGCPYFIIKVMMLMDQFNSNLAAEFSGVNQLIRVYRSLDLQIAKLKKITGLDCPPSCRSCCATAQSNIEVTLFELVPLAIHLWKRNEAEIWLTRAATAGATTDQATSPCVLYIANCKENRISGCRYYRLRPLICRLFGFGAIQSKYGQPRAVICKRLKLLRPESVGQVNRLLGSGIDLPDFSSLSLAVAAINPYLGEQRYPINQALKLTLEMVGYRRSLLMRSNAGFNGAKDHPSKPHPHLGKTA